MQVSSASSTSSASGAQSSSEIAKLQKQMRQLTDELKNVATSDMDAKAKKQRVEALQAQIQNLQTQIDAR